MRTMALFRAVAGMLAAAAAVCADPGDPEVVVVGRDTGDIAPCLAAFRLSASLAPDVEAVPSSAAAVLVLAGEGSPAPRELTASEARRLERLAAGGARVFVEYARSPGGLFGCTPAAEPRRPLHERLAVLRPMGVLQPEDLLEEHDQACLPFEALPAAAEALLEYDRALGTYRRIPTPERGLVTVVVDLGTTRTLTSASQRYGAGQPSYYPESVELWLSSDGKDFRPAGRLEASPMPETVRFDLPGEQARFVRFAIRKLRRSPVTDFLFLGEIEVRDAAGRNAALGAPYAVYAARGPSPAYPDDGRKLTDGVVEGLYTDGLSVGWTTPAPPTDARSPALVRVPHGEGMALLCAPCISTFRRREFRLTERWEELWRAVLLELLPPARRAEIAARRVPLAVHTEPRLWAEPGTPVKLVVETAPGAAVTARSERHGPLTLAPADGLLAASFAAPNGLDRITVTAATASGNAVCTVPFEGLPRAQAYRRALDRNLVWFRRSGVLPASDGSRGIYSQVCLAWLDSRAPGYDPLGSPFRVDCNAMSAEAFYLYGLLTGDAECRAIARNLADTVLAHQYTEAGRASLGGFPWLYEDNETLFLWDDNCRIGTALLWLYHWTGEERYLRSALLGAELFRQVARDDGCVHRHAIQRGELDRLGREAYRQFADGRDPEFRLMHWWTLAAVTGDGAFRALAETCTRLWGPAAGPFGGSFAAHYAPDERLAGRLADHAERFLGNPEVRRFGMGTVGGGGYEAAFEGDCGIATADGEPLTDQLYDTPWRFLWALRAWKATGSDPCRRMCESVGDYLVRTQFASPDPRLDGCWMRGFDVQRWEVYGAPYDPAYGPYSAYTGWMNAIAAQAFAWYLLDESPFIPPGRHPEAARVLGAVRALSPVLLSDGPNVALGCPYRFSEPPCPAYPDSGGELTDGVIDGPYEDQHSVGWSLPAQGAALSITLDLDLGRVRRVRLVTQQYGAGRGDYNPDLVRMSGSPDGIEYQALGVQRFAARDAGLLWQMLPQPAEVRWLRLELAKRRISPVTDFLFVGETRVWEDR